MWDFIPPPSHVLRKRVDGAFDGSHADFILNWLVIKPGVTVVSLEDMESMFKATVDGHLAWVCIPPPGYRV